MKAASNQYALRINLQYTAKAFLATKLSKHLNAVAFLPSQPKESPRFLRLGGCHCPALPQPSSWSSGPVSVAPAA